MGSGGQCITDCSILNQTTCQPVSRRQLVTYQDMEMFLLTSDESGCYNSSLFQSTPEYESYEKVKFLKVTKFNQRINILSVDSIFMAIKKKKKISIIFIPFS